MKSPLKCVVFNFSQWNSSMVATWPCFVFLFEWKFLFAILKCNFFYRGHTICTVFCLVGNYRRGLTSILRLYLVDRYFKASLFAGIIRLMTTLINPVGGSFEILRGMIPFIICCPFGILFLFFSFQLAEVGHSEYTFFIPVLWIIKSEHLQVHIAKQLLLVT